MLACEETALKEKVTKYVVGDLVIAHHLAEQKEVLKRAIWLAVSKTLREVNK